MTEESKPEASKAAREPVSSREFEVPRPSRPLIQGLAAGLLLGLASPGVLVPGFEFLGVLGLVLLFDVLRAERRSYLSAWLAGLVFHAWIGWSLRHVLLPGYLMMLPVGACYFLLLRLMTGLWERRVGASSLPFCFALSFASVEFLRAAMPEIPYPHAQLSHALYEWPLLLLPVRVLGEAGMNFLVAALAAGLWCLWRWKGEDARRRLPLGIAGGSWLLFSVLPAGTIEPLGKPLHVGLVQGCLPSYPDQPGFREYYSEKRRTFVVFRYRELLRDRAGEDFDLLVFSERGVPESIFADLEKRQFQAFVPVYPPARYYLFAGGHFERKPGGGDRRDPHSYDMRIAAWFVDRQGRVLGRHEKQRLVPAGEFIPILPKLLGEEAFEALAKKLAETFQEAPLVRVGRPAPLAQFPDGRAFGIAICFENAFPEPFIQQARGGASFFCVSSHEGWYRGGRELDQLLATTVFRALETGRPIVRATTDGCTAWIDGAGKIRAQLPRLEEGVLSLDLQPVQGGRAAMGWGLALPYLFFAVLFSFLLLGKRLRFPPPEG